MGGVSCNDPTALNIKEKCFMCIHTYSQLGPIKSCFDKLNTEVRQLRDF